MIRVQLLMRHQNNLERTIFTNEGEIYVTSLGVDGGGTFYKDLSNFTRKLNYVNIYD